MPIRNEAAYIEQSLRSILLQDYPAHRLEILIVDGNSTDATRDRITQVWRQFPLHQIKIIDNPRQYMPMGFNLGIKHTRSEIIIMMGGHAVLAEDYVTQCVKLLNEHTAACVGGAMETVASGFVSRRIATAMGSSFGVGGVAFRTRPNRLMEVDTAVFGAYRRTVFAEIGCLDEEMVRNQDDEFNYRLREHGGKILFSPLIRSRYYSRSSFSALWKQYYQYGFWKVRVLQKHPLQMSPRQFVPPLFVLGLLGSALLAFIPPLRPLSPVLPLLYLAANITASTITAAKKGWEHFPVLPLVFSILHLSYGLGFLAGMLKFWNRWGDKVGKTPAWSGESIG
jgi:GT2 family glycosyltransferase